MAQPLAASSARPRAKAWEWPRWVEPTFTVVALSLFGLYSLWEVLFHQNGQYQNYLSPFFSPTQDWGIRFFPAVWAVWVPLIFRGSCYYYRREYFRGFFRDPYACAVAEHKRRYDGESRLPWSANNLHRYAWYLVFVVLVFLWKDTVSAFFFPHTGFGVGVGSLLMLVNVVCLTLYSFSCHAFRHMIGGGRDRFTRAGQPTAAYRVWHAVSQWNARHGSWAWISMFTVWGTDVYIRLLLSGVLSDPRLIR